MIENLRLTDQLLTGGIVTGFPLVPLAQYRVNAKAPAQRRGRSVLYLGPVADRQGEWRELVRVRFIDTGREGLVAPLHLERICRVCGCTELDCRGCIERTGSPCSWIAIDLCSACEGGRAA